jgi:PAS domain S-box-containing protein
MTDRQSVPPDSQWLQRWADSTADHAIFSLEPDGRIAHWTLSAGHVLGYQAGQVKGRHLSWLFGEDSEATALANDLLATTLGTGTQSREALCGRADGMRFWASTTLTALRDTEGDLLGFATLIRDISASRRAQEAAIESERRFRLLVQGVTDYAIFMLSPEGYITNWNLGARRIKGYTAEQIIGSHFSRFYTPEDAAAGVPQRGLETAAREGRFEAEGWRVRRDGTQFWAHVVIDAIRDEQGVLIGFAKVTRDVTERRQAAEQLEQTRAALFQAQKMEAIGKLIGGVAHDFNNVLQVMRGNLELLVNRHRLDDWSLERLGHVIAAVERGAKLAAQLLAFGRQQTLRPLVINLSAVVRAMDELLRRALGETIDVETVVAGGLWNTHVDPHQLENVILNLAINARDAMPSGGKLTLELGNAMLDENYVRAFADVAAGQYVMLAITDTGTGMQPEVVERAFEPFFTTKPVGEGTGLGLSMAYGFVKQSGGHIRIYSEPGHGTTIKIYLPRSMEAAQCAPVRRSATLTGGKETILVVEDDRTVQSTAIEMLSELGYTVLTADDAEQALAVLRSGVHVDLLFTDVVMPGSLRSPDMVRQVVALFPHLKVLFTSGYTQNAVVHGGRLDPGVELLAKPYSQEDLSFKIRQVLGPADEASEPSDVSLAAADESSHPGGDALSILVVDDDEESLEAVSQMLTLSGHVVRTAHHAEQALEAIKQSRFDVLLTDVNLPGTSGLELASAAVLAQPSLRVVVASGAPLEEILPGRAWTVLRKPYSMAALDQVLRSWVR